MDNAIRAVSQRMALEKVAKSEMNWLCSLMTVKRLWSMYPNKTDIAVMRNPNSEAAMLAIEPYRVGPFLLKMSETPAVSPL